jgi:hypothetical protein
MHGREQFDRSAVPAAELAAYDRVNQRQTAYAYARPAGQEAGPYFGRLNHTPLIADHISELGVLYRRIGETGTSYAHADREWVDMVLCQELRRWSTMYGHLRDAVAVGVRPDAIRALREGRDEDLTPEERQLAEYIRAVVRGTVTAGMYDGIEARFGERGAVEYTALIGHLLMTVRLLQALGTPERPESDVDALLDGVLAGTVELPHPKARVPAP